MTDELAPIAPQPQTSLLHFPKSPESVNPPSEQIEEAFSIAEQSTIESITPELFPTTPFFPPSEGFQITSELTNNTYVIGQVIGEGAFGTVYSASDLWLNDLAVKVLKPVATYEQIQQAASQEFQKLFTLRNTNITHVLDAFEFKNAFYIVTERCHAPLIDLFRIEKLDGLLWVKPVARCLLQAVQFLHNSGYVHQDIHFGNVFMQFHRDEMGNEQNSFASMTFKLGDLGIAKLFSEIDAQNTLLNGSMFPPEFLAPQDFGVLGKQVDIYHCGLLLLQLAIGRQLIFSNDEIVQGIPRQLAELLPAPFGPALAKALRRHVRERTQSARDLWLDLNAPDPHLL